VDSGWRVVAVGSGQAPLRFFPEVRIPKELGEKQLTLRGSGQAVESSKLKRERFGELNAETQSAQRSESGAEAITPGSFAALRMTDSAQGRALGGRSLRLGSLRGFLRGSLRGSG
jgi:hypothetical protein